MRKRITHTSAGAYASLGEMAATLRAKAFRLIHESGQRGMTEVEIAEAAGCDRFGMQPRVSELFAKKSIVDSGRTRTNPSGREAIVWVVPEFGPEPQEAAND